MGSWTSNDSADLGTENSCTYSTLFSTLGDKCNEMHRIRLRFIRSLESMCIAYAETNHELSWNKGVGQRDNYIVELHLYIVKLYCKVGLDGSIWGQRDREDSNIHRRSSHRRRLRMRSKHILSRETEFREKVWATPKLRSLFTCKQDAWVLGPFQEEMERYFQEEAQFYNYLFQFEDDLMALISTTIHGHALRRSGLKMIVNGQNLDAFGDTGSSYDIVDEAYVHKHGLRMISQETYLQQGDKSSLFSPGTVELEVAFDDDPAKPIKTLARVVRDFPFDLLLGHGFLRKTKTLSTFFYRFKMCIFPRLRSKLAFHFVGDVSERFKVKLNDSIVVGATLDTGSNCSVVDYSWAKLHGLNIETREESRGWIYLPSGRKATLGQVHTTVTLPDGRVVPHTFEVLESCATNLVLCDEIIFKYNLYDQAYADSFSDNENVEQDNALLHMDYKPWYLSALKKATNIFGKPDCAQDVVPAVNDADELKRQRNWDRDNDHGRAATKEEWLAEFSRRKKHERALYPGISLQDKMLIRYKSNDMARRSD